MEDRTQLKIRLTEAERGALEAAATKTGRTLSGEVVARLSASFAEDSLRTLIREELEADRKRQASQVSAYQSGARTLADLTQGYNAGALFGPKDIFAAGALKSADQSKP